METFQIEIECHRKQIKYIKEHDKDETKRLPKFEKYLSSPSAIHKKKQQTNNFEQNFFASS